MTARAAVGRGTSGRHVEPEGPWYVYGVAGSGLDPAALQDVEGIGSNGPTVVEHLGLAAVVELLDEGAPAGARRSLMAHYRVLNAVSGHAAVLPLRFGTVLEDPEAVRTVLLAPQQDELEATLAALVGHVQLVVKARYVADAVLAEVVAADPRIRELNARTRDLPGDAAHHDRVRLGELVAQAVEATRVVDREQLVEALRPHAVDWSVRDGSGVEGLCDLSLLVATGQRATVEAAAADLAHSWADRVTVQVLGPMAPFDFVRAG